MLTILDRYEYNHKDLLDWNPATGVLIFKGCLKESPNQKVNIKIIPNAFGKLWIEEVQKLENQENDGLITIVEQVQIGNNFYLIFSNISKEQTDDTYFTTSPDISPTNTQGNNQFF